MTSAKAVAPRGVGSPAWANSAGCHSLESSSLQGAGVSGYVTLGACGEP